MTDHPDITVSEGGDVRTDSAGRWDIHTAARVSSMIEMFGGKKKPATVGFPVPRVGKSSVSGKWSLPEKSTVSGSTALPGKLPGKVSVSGKFSLPEKSSVSGDVTGAGPR